MCIFHSYFWMERYIGKKRNFLENILYFFSPVKENKRITLYFVWYFFLEWSFVIAFIFFVKHATEAFESQKQELFYSVLTQYFFIFIWIFLILLISYRWWTYSYNRYASTIEKYLFPKYIQFDNTTYEKTGTGKSIAIISKGVKTWSGLLDKIIIHVLELSISVIITGYLLLQVSSWLLLLLVILLFSGQLLWFWLNKRVAINRRKRIELDNTWSRNVVKIIMAKMEILQTQQIHKESQKLHTLHEWQIFYNQKMSLYLVPFYALWYIIIAILLFGVFLHFGELYFSEQVSLGVIAALTGSILMMQKDFINILDFIKNFVKDFAEVENLWDFFDNTPQIQWYEEWKTFIYKNGDIHIQNISYSYENSSPVFQNFSLDIPGSKITALVWPSGGGKSTLVKLISGYIRQDSGDIIVDTQNLRDTSLKSYYADVWYLTQEPSVFDGTVEENLLYAVTQKPSENQIKKIIKLAHCDFIYDLPEGLQTEIGERGIKLSGGQKQRLAIAKIFLKDPKIIILDEPTSALDSLSEQKITEAMHNLFEGRTVIIIAHRLQTVKHADDIIVIESGSIIERGTHASLVRKKWYYKEMLDLQSGF